MHIKRRDPEDFCLQASERQFTSLFMAATQIKSQGNEDSCVVMKDPLAMDIYMAFEGEREQE